MLLLKTPESDPRRKKVDVIHPVFDGRRAITRRLFELRSKQVSDIRVVDPREHVPAHRRCSGVCSATTSRSLDRGSGARKYSLVDPDQLDRSS